MCTLMRWFYLKLVGAAELPPTCWCSLVTNIEEHVKNGERPLIPYVTPTGFTKLIEQGWHQKPEERPGIHYFLRRLEASAQIL